MLFGAALDGFDLPVRSLQCRRCAQCLERGIDFQLNAAFGQRRQPRLSLAGLHVIPNLESPLPDIRFGRGREGIVYAFMNHETTLPEADEESMLPCIINPVEYGSGPATQVLPYCGSSESRPVGCPRTTRSFEQESSDAAKSSICQTQICRRSGGTGPTPFKAEPKIRRNQKSPCGEQAKKAGQPDRPSFFFECCTDAGAAAKQPPCEQADLGRSPKLTALT